MPKKAAVAGSKIFDPYICAVNMCVVQTSESLFLPAKVNIKIISREKQRIIYWFGVFCFGKCVIFAAVIKDTIMPTVTLEYSNNNIVLNGILEAVAKMPDVKFILNIDNASAKAGTQKLSREELFLLAKKLDSSVNPNNVPVMSMEEIVQEVRDYRNGK